jgi:hypothetical protein
MFRHFFSDPTPAKLMRERAPRTLAWVTRLWALTPSQFADRPAIESVPEAVTGLLKLSTTSHLPYYAANAKAVAEGLHDVTFMDFGATFTVPASPYRAWCLSELQSEFSALSPEHQSDVIRLFADDTARTILAAKPGQVSLRIPALPIRPTASATKTLDRNWV